jgi:hypothetical protein
MAAVKEGLTLFTEGQGLSKKIMLPCVEQTEDQDLTGFIFCCFLETGWGWC